MRNKLLHIAIISLCFLGSTVGPKLPNTSGTGAYSTGTRAWSSTTNILTENATNATTGTGSGGLSDDLLASNFQFTEVSGATIQGIQAEVKVSHTGGTAAGDITELYIVYQSARQSADKSTGQATTTTLTWYSWGGASDTWGISPTGNDLSGGDFGIDMVTTNPTGGTGTRRINCDAFRVTLTYTAAAVTSRKRVIGGFTPIGEYRKMQAVSMNGQVRYDTLAYAYMLPAHNSLDF